MPTTLTFPQRVGIGLRALVAPLALPLLALRALQVRGDTLRRQRRGDKPRLVFGPTPVINIKYIRQAVERLGYTAATVVYQPSIIHTRSDYDYYLYELVKLPLPAWLYKRLMIIWGPYLGLFWLLSRFDIFHFYFDGGFLASTPLRFLEVWLLHLAGKKVIVMPYGSDCAVNTLTRSLLWRQGLLMQYRDLGAHERETLRQIDYFSRNADFIVAVMVHLETLPVWDMLTTLYYPIDTDAWPACQDYSPHDGRTGPVVVVHAPNHRGVKGTEFLIQACRELQAEGLQVELRLLERVPNTEVRRILSQADILADQFFQGFALAALEGMALAKPVMSNLADDRLYLLHRLYTGLDECPILSTPVTAIKDNLRRLVTDPALRQHLGLAGRQYVLKFHSYATVGRMWHLVYRKLWHGEPLDLAVWHPDRFSET